MNELKEQCVSLLQKNESSLKELGANAVGLFGSFARDENSLKSDFDIIICADSIRQEDNLSVYVKNLLRPLGRDIDVNFRARIGIGNRLWANILRDSIMAFGDLPIAKSRMEKFDMKHEKSNLIVCEVANRFPKFSEFFKEDLEKYKASPNENEDMAIRIAQKIVGSFDPSIGKKFFEVFDEVALDVLGYNTIRVDPPKPGKDPRKKHLERD